MNRLNQWPWNPISKKAGKISPKSNGTPANPFGLRQSRRPSLRPLLVWCALLVLHLLLFPPPTYAYIDPGTGSYIIQVLIAGLLGVLVSLRFYWARIKAFFKRCPPFGRKDPAQHE